MKKLLILVSISCILACLALLWLPRTAFLSDDELELVTERVHKKADVRSQFGEPERSYSQEDLECLVYRPRPWGGALIHFCFDRSDTLQITKYLAAH
jgi:hypothetical protein